MFMLWCFGLYGSLLFLIPVFQLGSDRLLKVKKRFIMIIVGSTLLGIVVEAAKDYIDNRIDDKITEAEIWNLEKNPDLDLDF